MASHSGFRQASRFLALAVVLLVTVIWAPAVRTATEPSRDIDTYALFAYETIAFKGRNACPTCGIVTGGNVGANGIMPANGNPTLSFGANGAVIMPTDGTHAVGDSTRIGNNGDLYQLFSNKANNAFNAAAVLRNPPTLSFTHATPGAAIIDPADLPPDPVCTALVGDPGFNVQKNGSSSLPSGNYGVVTVRDGATLTLEGPAVDDPNVDDVYQIHTLHLGKGATLITEADTVVFVKTKFNINNDSFVGPESGAQFNVCSFNVSHNDASVTFSRQSEIHGQFFAPDGGINLGHSTNLFGRFWAKSLNSDWNVNVTYECPDCEELCTAQSPVSDECPCVEGDTREACSSVCTAQSPVSDECPCVEGDTREACQSVCTAQSPVSDECPCVEGDTREACSSVCTPESPVSDECPCVEGDTREACPSVCTPQSQVSDECPCVEDDPRQECTALSCVSCAEGLNGDPVVFAVTNNVTVNFEVNPPTCNDGVNPGGLCDYFAADKSGGATPDKWKAVFDLGNQKFLLKAGKTISTGAVADRVARAGVEIRTSCLIEIEPTARIVVDTKLAPTGPITLVANGDITINGQVLDRTRDSHVPGDVNVASACGEISVGRLGRVQTMAGNFGNAANLRGGSDVNILSCGEGGSISISGLVSAQAETLQANGAGPAPDVNLFSFGTIRIDGGTGTVPAAGYNDYTPDLAGSLRRFDIYPGVLSWVTHDSFPGSVNIQGSGGVTIVGHGKSDKRSFAAVAAGSSGPQAGGTSRGGNVDILSLQGELRGTDRAVESFGNNNTAARLLLWSRGDMSFEKLQTGAGFAPLVSSAGAAGLGGDNFLRSFDGGITLKNLGSPLVRIVSAGSGGTNNLTSKVGVSIDNVAGLLPLDGNLADDIGAGDIGPAPNFDSCSDLVNINFPSAP